MGGIIYIVVGAVLLSVSTVGVVFLELWLQKKKHEIRQQIYQIYD